MLRGVVLALVGIFALPFGLFAVTGIAPSVASAEETPNCGTAHYEEGLDKSKSKFVVEESSSSSTPRVVVLNMTTKAGRICKDYFYIKRENIPRSEFENPPSDLGSGRTFTSFQSRVMPKYFSVAGRKWTQQFIEKEFEITLIVDTDPDSSSYRFTAGIYLRNERNLVHPWLGWGGGYDIINGPYISWPTFYRNYGEGSIVSGIATQYYNTYKGILDELHTMRNRLVKGLEIGAQTDNPVKISGDIKIDFTGSELEKSGVSDGAGPLSGIREKLPDLGGQTLNVALFARNPDYTQRYSFIRNIPINTTAKSFSEGKFNITQKLPIGDYIAAVAINVDISLFVQVAGEGGVYEGESLANALDLSQYDSNLDDLEGSIIEENESYYYFGITGEGRRALFYGASFFQLKKDSTEINGVDPTMKLRSETTSLGVLDIDGCSVAGIVNPLKGGSTIGNVFRALNVCFYQYVIDPVIQWAVQLITHSAGIAFTNHPAHKYS